MTGAEKACEMLKTLRGAWMTKRQIAKHLELRPDTVAEWVDDWQRIWPELATAEPAKAAA